MLLDIIISLQDCFESHGNFKLRNPTPAGGKGRERKGVGGHLALAVAAS
jgi:hypothetical protein